MISRRLISRPGSALLAAATACWMAVACGDGSTSPTTPVELFGAVQVSTASPSGWGFLEEVPNGTGSFVTGPGTPPLGFGSARLTVDATGRMLLGTLAYAGTRFDQISALQYSTFVPTGQPANLAITLQFDVDYDLTDGNTAWQGRLVFEPLYTGAVTQGAWQTWFPLSGKWWASGAPGNAVCTPATPCSWADLLSAFPNAGLRAGDGVLWFKAGGPWAPGFTGYVDAFAITAGGQDATFDFEPSLEPCAVSSDDASRTVRFTGDCTTDHTLYIPNGWTVDGAGHTLTAVNPAGGDFLGAVLRNGGAWASVRNLHIVGDVGGGCHDGPDHVERFRGILFDGAAGTIMSNTVENILRTPNYGCQEGNAIEARNAPFDGTHPHTLQVVIQQNTVLRYQKTGILTNGDLRAVINNNTVSSAATATGENLDDDIAANSIQVGFGVAHATIHGNHVQGNDWDGASYYDATAMLIYSQVGDVEISNNEIGAGSPVPLDEKTDIGIYVEDAGTVNIMNNYIGRHSEDESGKPCQGRPDGAFEVVPADRCDPDGVGVYIYGTSGISKVVNNRFAGDWIELQVGADKARRNRVVPAE